MLTTAVIKGIVHSFNMLTYMMQLFTLLKMVKPTPPTDEGMKRNVE